MSAYLGHVLAFVCVLTVVCLMFSTREKFKSQSGWALMLLGCVTEATEIGTSIVHLHAPMLLGVSKIVFLAGLLLHLANLSTNGKPHA